MTEGSKRLAAVRAALPAYELAPGSLQSMHRQVRADEKRRRARAQRVAGALLAVMVVGSAGIVHVARRSDAPAPIEEGPLLARPVRLHDGTQVAPLPAGGRFVLTGGYAGRSVELVAGAARFDVVPASRTFRVTAGGVTVEVLGTAFVVERRAADVRVAVERGRVRVLSAGEARALGAGEALVFPLEPPEVRAPAAPSTAVAAPTSSLPPGVARAESPAPTSAQARTAGEALTGPQVEREDRLWPAADRARREGRFREAAQLLRAFLRARPADANAPLAGFTLGRLLLDELGKPREAAAAFAAVRRSGGPLAPDAWAREVEAYARAGEGTRARAAAQAYLRRHPASPQARLVRRHGGLEPPAGETPR